MPNANQQKQGLPKPTKLKLYAANQSPKSKPIWHCPKYLALLAVLIILGVVLVGAIRQAEESEHTDSFSSALEEERILSWEWEEFGSTIYYSKTEEVIPTFKIILKTNKRDIDLPGPTWRPEEFIRDIDLPGPRWPFAQKEMYLLSPSGKFFVYIDKHEDPAYEPIRWLDIYSLEHNTTVNLTITEVRFIDMAFLPDDRLAVLSEFLSFKDRPDDYFPGLTVYDIDKIFAEYPYNVDNDNNNRRFVREKMKPYVQGSIFRNLDQQVTDLSFSENRIQIHGEGGEVLGTFELGR